MNAQEEAMWQLTQQQVCALPSGTAIVVTWSGGNGPHGYVLEYERGIAHAVMYQGNRRYLVGGLYQVGCHPLTQVWVKR